MQGVRKTIKPMNHGISILFRAIPLAMAAFCFAYGAYIFAAGTDAARLTAGPVVFYLGSICIALYCTAATVILLYSKKLGIPAIILAALICFTRLYLYVHFPSDVICGALFGILLAFLSNFLVNKIWEKINERKLSNNSKQND